MELTKRFNGSYNKAVKSWLGTQKAAKKEVISAPDLFKSYPDVVTVPQVMEMLHIGKTKTYKLLRTGKIKAKRDESGYYIITKSAVKEYVLKIENQADILSDNLFTSTRNRAIINKTVVGM